MSKETGPQLIMAPWLPRTPSGNIIPPAPNGPKRPANSREFFHVPDGKIDEFISRGKTLPMIRDAHMWLLYQRKQPLVTAQDKFNYRLQSEVLRLVQERLIAASTARDNIPESGEEGLNSECECERCVAARVDGNKEDKM